MECISIYKHTHLLVYIEIHLLAVFSRHWLPVLTAHLTCTCPVLFTLSAHNVIQSIHIYSYKTKMAAIDILTTSNCFGWNLQFICQSCFSVRFPVFVIVKSISRMNLNIWGHFVFNGQFAVGRGRD